MIAKHPRKDYNGYKISRTSILIVRKAKQMQKYGWNLQLDVRLVKSRARKRNIDLQTYQALVMENIDSLYGCSKIPLEALYLRMESIRCDSYSSFNLLNNFLIGLITGMISGDFVSYYVAGKTLFIAVPLLIAIFFSLYLILKLYKSNLHDNFKSNILDEYELEVISK